MEWVNTQWIEETKDGRMNGSYEGRIEGYMEEGWWKGRTEKKVDDNREIKIKQPQIVPE